MRIKINIKNIFGMVVLITAYIGYIAGYYGFEDAKKLMSANDMKLFGTKVKEKKIYQPTKFDAQRNFTFDQDDTFENWQEVTYVNKGFKRGSLKIVGEIETSTTLGGQVITMRTLEYTATDNSTLNEVIEFISNALNSSLGNSSESNVYIKFNGNTHEQ